MAAGAAAGRAGPAGRPEGADHARRQLAATGWLPAPGTSPPPGEAAGVEVFDQVSALPDGWGSGGPESRLARPRTDRGPTPRRTRPRQPTGPGPPALPAVTASADLPPAVSEPPTPTRRPAGTPLRLLGLAGIVAGLVLLVLAAALVW